MTLEECVNAFFDHPLLKIGMSIAVLTTIIVFPLCMVMSFVRRRGLDPMTSVWPLEEYPMITVVMCCKGVHDRSLVNFKRNLAMEYPGTCEFVFVVEAEDDPAMACAKQAINEAGFTDETRSAQVVIAGLSFHNAQKIHNMLHGVVSASPESKYVLFADDDVFFYPGLCEELVTPLVQEPERVMVSTGYEFVVPPATWNLAAYCLVFYRIHNLWSFITTRPILCWGGCWMAPLSMFRKNVGRLVDCYIDGGYSDDTIVACIAQECGYVCAHPYRAIFPSIVGPDMTVRRYWDFLNRQFFVMDTYQTDYSRSVGHSLACMTVGAIWLLGMWGIAAPVPAFIAIISHFAFDNFVWTYAAKMAVAAVPGVLLIAWSMRHATDSMVRVSNSLRPPDQHITCTVTTLRMWIGFMVHGCLLPLAVCNIMIRKFIVWSNVRYYKENGKITKVERRDSNGDYTVTELASSSIARMLSDPRFRSMVNGTYGESDADPH